MNLIKTAWIPVDRQSGPNQRIAPHQITDAEDPVIHLAAPRPDFNGALLQFLIGLLQTACAPEDQNQWAEWLEQPPPPATLEKYLSPLAYAFELDSDGPQFMQDFDELDGDQKAIASLLIDAPGAQTQRQNADHFIKRNQVESACPACAATALFTLQTNAPSGGAGHRTSLRGGGPLSTLIALDPVNSDLPNDLWRTIWLNVLDQAALRILPGDTSSGDPKVIFPWLTHTRTSEKRTGRNTTPVDAHALQMYWGMPRRIRIDWEDTRGGICDLCGTASDRLVFRYLTQNYGTNYSGVWQHPLSPHQINKEGEPLPRHAQPGGINYRHWLALTSGGDSEIPALVVKVFADRKLDAEQLRLHVFGYDMDNMKARCWYDVTFPLYSLNPSILERFSTRIRALIDAASKTANLTRSSIKEAWFKRPGDTKGDTAFLVEAFLNQTENAFFAQLEELIGLLESGNDGRTSLYSWQATLSRSALNLFDYWTTRGDFETINPRRVVEARRKLSGWLHSKSTGLHKMLGITGKEKAA